MQIGIPREELRGETRVAATPKTVAQLIKLGHSVVVEAGAGAKSSYPDAEFAAAGATIGDQTAVWTSPVVAKINAPTDDEIARLTDGAMLISLIAPGRSPELLEKLAARRITVLAMDAVPRISRAQSLDVLSSMANIAGYRAVVEAANQFGSFFTGQVTAAGKVPPAKVLVAGAGVAGLAAIGTAKSLGAIVRATDTRPEVAEQVASMGGEFVSPRAVTQEISADGYAKEMGEDYKLAAAELYAEQARDVDIVITTALIPGRPAPRLLTAEMVASMKPGSVIVDMAAANGGNVEGSKPDEVVVTDNGVKIIGYTDLAGRLPTQASQLYGTNVVNLFTLLTPGKDGEVVLDLDDVVLRGMTVQSDGEVLWPPPPVQVSAAPVAVAAVAEDPAVRAAREAALEKARSTRRLVMSVVAAVLVIAAVTFSPASFVGAFTVFALAVVVGFYVVSGVSHSLHTPLMAQTNAISGIILVGALLQLGSTNLAVLVMSFIAATIASINIFGGFLVSYRMLGMFKKEA